VAEHVGWQSCSGACLSWLTSVANVPEVGASLFSLARLQTSVIYHLMTALVTIIAFVSYLAMVMELGGLWIRYLDWVTTTPLLLIDIAFLAGMPAALVCFLAVVDALMIVTGFAAETAETAAQVWVMFGLSSVSACACGRCVLSVHQHTLPFPPSFIPRCCRSPGACSMRFH
jgi:bacteriorhodopsin